ncbi:MAG TPA: hypothetical protein VLH56_02320 [Dissulfurispiraceae bacterium]|nr:hypothetical protein [Dissulfurispiraceae bacterium]
MTSFIYPDLDWYSKISAKENVTERCPYANVHRCPRYYASLYMLGNAGVTTQMKPEKIKELDELWNQSELLPVIAEHDTSITKVDDKINSFSNFCPEVLFDIFGLFAVSLIRYADEIDQTAGYAQMEKDVYPKDWRSTWAHAESLHYLKCSVYSQLLTHPVKNKHDTLTGGTIPEIIEIKPGFMGISLNIRAAFSRLAKWWLSKQNR